MLADLDRQYPRAVPALLGYSRRAIDNWKTGRQLPGVPAARSIWLVWVALRSGVVSPVEVLTWGKIRTGDPQ